ncbi:MAG: aminopeptidase P family protein [Planctomycetes bacterium]|nr:aminopeptidase P family protein [Planctomycetota bacterium]
MDNKTIKTRIKAVRRLLGKKAINCLIITKPANVTYMTGFLGSDSWALITRKNVYLLTDSRYTEQAKNQCHGCKIAQYTGSISQACAEFIKKSKIRKSVTIEKSSSIAVVEALGKHFKGRIKTAADTIESVRSIKDKGEITAIRSASRIAAKALAQTKRYMKPGITENELAGRLDFQIRKLGATISFETIVAFGANASQPHHQVGNKKLKKNDTVLIDFGVKHKGYCCDLTRCFTVGKPNTFYNKVYKAVQEAHTAAIKAVKAGVKISKIDAAAREVIRKYDLPQYGHGTGHGLGLEVHEQPVISDKNKGKLKSGMVFTIEPGVYIPGKLGIRLEDDIVVTETGYKILSNY